MERAFKDATPPKNPQVAYYHFQSSTPQELKAGTKESPVVYKLHGTMEEPASMICTEDDVVQFLAQIIREDPGLPSSITELFQRRSFLFVGYGLRDWNVRVLIRALRGRKPVDLSP